MDSHREGTGIALVPSFDYRLKSPWLGTLCTVKERGCFPNPYSCQIHSSPSVQSTWLSLLSLPQMIICSHYSLKLCGFLTLSIRFSKNLYHIVKGISMCSAVLDSWKVVLRGSCFQLVSKLLGAWLWLPISPGRHFYFLSKSSLSSSSYPGWQKSKGRSDFSHPNFITWKGCNLVSGAGLVKTAIGLQTILRSNTLLRIGKSGFLDLCVSAMQTRHEQDANHTCMSIIWLGFSLAFPVYRSYDTVSSSSAH